MSLLLKDRDYVADGSGGVTVVQDGEELLSEVLFRLTARRDSFPFLPGLGSRMDQLRRVKPSERESLALQYAVEALEDMEGVRVTAASARRDGDGLLVTVALLREGASLPVEIRPTFGTRCTHTRLSPWATSVPASPGSITAPEWASTVPARTSSPARTMFCPG